MSERNFSHWKERLKEFNWGGHFTFLLLYNKFSCLDSIQYPFIYITVLWSEVWWGWLVPLRRISKDQTEDVGLDGFFFEALGRNLLPNWSKLLAKCFLYNAIGLGSLFLLSARDLSANRVCLPSLPCVPFHLYFYKRWVRYFSCLKILQITLFSVLTGEKLLKCF